jgi:hypothetical protein
MAVKRSIEYTDLLTNGEVVARLLESGDWSFGLPDKLSKRDIIIIRALLNTLIEEQEIIK